MTFELDRDLQDIRLAKSNGQSLTAKDRAYRLAKALHATCIRLAWDSIASSGTIAGADNESIALHPTPTVSVSPIKRGYRKSTFELASVNGDKMTVTCSSRVVFNDGSGDVTVHSKNLDEMAFELENHAALWIATVEPEAKSRSEVYPAPVLQVS